MTERCEIFRLTDALIGHVTGLLIDDQPDRGAGTFVVRRAMYGLRGGMDPGEGTDRLDKYGLALTVGTVDGGLGDEGVQVIPGAVDVLDACGTWVLQAGGHGHDRIDDIC